jgi:hypothetical protein
MYINVGLKLCCMFFIVPNVNIIATKFCLYILEILRYCRLLFLWDKNDEDMNTLLVQIAFVLWLALFCQTMFAVTIN